MIHKIVLTGGPCAGKTTAMSWIRNAFTARGYTVLFVPETATELITGGVTPSVCGSNDAFQTCLIDLQQNKERVFINAAASIVSDKILIVCDHAILDNKAYMSEEEFSVVLDRMHANEVELRDGYDAVFHMVTAAKGAEQYYTLANNAARTETVEQAIEIDNRLIAAWTGHPHLRVIDNSTGFDNKLRRLIAEIAAAIGDPEPFEIERKYLIAYPDTEALEQLPNCQKIDILQTYLLAREGEEMRIRQRGIQGNYMYYLTTKRPVSDGKRVEVERRLSQQEYVSLLMDADPDCRQIRKSRYCLTIGNQYLEIDVYPSVTTHAILEIELQSELEPVTIPDFLRVIREVTDETAFHNHSLARNGFPALI